MKRRLTSKSDTSRKTTASRHARRGLAATELVMILPLLMVIVFGCLDLSRATRHYMVLCNAVRTGAEYGATQRFTPYTKSAWETRVQDVVNEELQEISGDPTLSAFTINIKEETSDNA
ncbi:MAG: pilus assembly protein, partial [Planctomycetes bacterium]|nr:pilus assembly protein [Planctomycetota bacterium]